MDHYFAGNPLDRGEAERRDEAWLEARRRDGDSRYLPLLRLQVPISGDGESTRLAWTGPQVLDRLGWDAPEPVFLGLAGGIAHFAVDVTSAGEGADLGLGAGARFQEARSVVGSLPLQEGGIVAQAKAQVDWHARHRFCGVCGVETSPERGGQQRRCPGCKADHFPRTDPVAIVLVHDGAGRCLLGQSRLWGLRGSFYSCISGFIDQGESIEEAVRREVREEAGLELAEVAYHSSQPWPFPSSLMIGCLARAATTEIHFDPEEMNDVRWFSRDEIESSLRGENPGLSLPGRIAIAHHLVMAWVRLES